MSAYERLIEMCKAKSIDYERHEHEPLYTIEDAVRVCGGTVDENIKTILLKAKDLFYLYVTTGSKKVPIRDLKEVTGEKRLSFARESDVVHMLGYSLGATTPIGNDKSIPVLVDKDVQMLTSVYINAGKNEITFKMSVNDFFKLLKDYHQYRILQ